MSSPKGMDTLQDVLRKDIISYSMINDPSVLKAYQVFKEHASSLYQKMKTNRPSLFAFSGYDKIKIVVSIDENDVSLLAYKHVIENFLHVLTQKGFRFFFSGCLLFTDVPNRVHVHVPEGQWEITVKSVSPNKRMLWTQAIVAGLICEYINYTISKSQIIFEMDSEPKQAIEDTLVETEVVKVAENTKITQEVDDSENAHVNHGDALQLISTTVDIARLAPISDRFVRVFNTPQFFRTSDEVNQEIVVLNVPDDLYSIFDNTVVSALRSYTSISTDIEIIVKINANQAQCGRYIMAAYPGENLEIETDRHLKDSVYRMLQRDHAIIDIADSNDVHLVVPYEYIRPWIPIQTDEVGTVTGGTFATIRIRCLSPVRIADSGNPVVPFQIFARLRNTQLSGMRFPVSIPTRSAPRFEMMASPSVQSPRTFDKVVKSLYSAAKHVPIFGSLIGNIGGMIGNTAVATASLFSSNQDRIKEFENRLIYVGVANKDKPIDIEHPRAWMPTPVHAYSYGRTPHSAKKLRLEPEATVPHIPDHVTVNDIKSINELAQIPGFMTSFQVSVTDQQGALLVELPAIPFDPRYVDLYPQLASNIEQLPPVAFLYNMFNFYSGSIIYEFVPVKTSSHNFSIQVGFVPYSGQRGSGITEAQIQSCEWKTLDFRTSQNGQFTTPWLSLNVMRPTPHAQSGIASSSSVGLHEPGIFPPISGAVNDMKDPGKVCVFLVNELNPTPIVSPVIDVLVFVKAAPNINFFSPTTSRVAQVYSPSISLTARQPASGSSVSQAWIPMYPAVEDTSNMVNIRYEMSSQSTQSGDEQTMPGDVVREATGPQVQNLESHSNLLDICRRSYFQITVDGMYQTVTGSNVTTPQPDYGIIPVVPYSLQKMPWSETAEYQYNRPILTPRDNILSMFRWMRGAVTCVIHSITNKPLEVTYLPAVDRPILLTGGVPYPLPAPGLSNTLPLHVYAFPQSVGLPTEVIEPRVNPILTVDVPMYNACNYIDLQSTLFNPNGLTTRINPKVGNSSDFSANYLGNLVIRSLNGDPIPIADVDSNKFKCRVLTSLSDETQLHHFIGVPPTYRYNYAADYTMVSANPSFRNRIKTRNEIENELIASGIESNPGPVFSKITSFFGDTGLSIANAFTSVGEIARDLRTAIQSPNEIRGVIQDIRAKGDGLVDYVKTILCTYVQGIDFVQVTALACSIVSALHTNTNVFAMLSVVCQILALTGVFHAEAISKAISKLTLIMSDNVRFEMENDSLVSMSTVFASIIIETYSAYSNINGSKLNLDENYVRQVFATTFKNFNLVRAGALCVLLTRVCNAVKILWKNVKKWIRGLEKHDILADDPKFVQGFMCDYEFFMDERNIPGQSLIQRHRDRYWTTLLTAYYLKSVLATADRKYVNVTLSNAVKDVITRANTLKSYMAAPPVRYEPYCFWMYGAPGTGKTTMMQDFAIDMAANINVKSAGDPIYVRSPHSQWWNGYDNQPIVTIDDANGVNDPTILGRMVSEFQAMKTSAKMRIEMPRLEEKNAEMTSVIFGVCSNFPTWKSTMILDQDAFNRRRDMLVETRWSNLASKWFAENPNVKKQASSLPPEILLDNKHLVFHVVDNPCGNLAVGKLYYFDEFKKHLLVHHSEYHKREMDKMAARYEKSLSLAKEFSGRVFDRMTLRAALEAVLLGCESSEVLGETMKRQLFELKQASPERYSQLPLHTRSMLDTMSKTEPNVTFDAPVTADYRFNGYQWARASDWVRNVVFPAYEVGSFGNHLDRAFRPWNYEDHRTFESDLITSECSCCREIQNINKPIAMLCPSSTQDNQHWVCAECVDAYRNHANYPACPVCRHEKMIKIHTSQQLWRFYQKVGWIAGIIGSMVTLPIQITMRLLWKYATTVAMCSVVAWSTYQIFSTVRDSLDRDQLMTDSMDDFINQYGIIPDTYLMTNNGVYFTVGGRQFRRDESGQFNLLPTVEFEGKKKIREIVDEALDKSKATTSKVDYSIIDGKLVAHSSTDVKTRNPDDSDSEVENDFKSIPDENVPDLELHQFVPHTKCCPEHDTENYSSLLDNPFISIHFDSDIGFSYNKMINGEIAAVTIPYLMCERKDCKYNHEFKKMFEHIYRTKISSWIESYKEDPQMFTNYEKAQELLDAPPREVEHILNNQIQQPMEPPQRFANMIHVQYQLYLSVRGRLIYWIQKIYEILCEKWKHIISLIVVIFAMYYGYKYYVTDDEEIVLEPVHEGSMDRSAGKGKNKATPNTRMYTKRNGPYHEMKLSVSNKIPNNISTISEIIFKNQFKLECEGYSVNGLVVANNIGLFPRHSFHLFAFIQSDSSIIMINTDGSKHLINDSISMHIVEDNVDCEYVVFQHKNLTGRDIRHHFFSTPHDEVAYPPYVYGIDLQTHEIRPARIIAVDQIENLDDVKPIRSDWPTKTKGVFRYESKIRDYITVAGFRGEGKCISPMLNPDGKIISLHFAGHTSDLDSLGFSAPVFQEMFERPYMYTNGNKTFNMVSFPNLKYYSHYPNPPYHTQTSKIEKSSIHDQAWQSLTYPCIQSADDERYKFSATPLLDGASTIGAHTIPPIPEILKSAIETVSQELNKHMPTLSMPVPVSVHEAVTAANHLHVEPMNLATSAGLPLIADFPGKHLKSDYIYYKVDNKIQHVELEAAFEKKATSCFNMRLKHMPIREPFWAHLKDERRKPEKLESFGGTRVFSVAPLELVLSSRRALLPMMDAFHSSPIQLHHAIGLSPDSIQWTQLIETLRSRSKYIVQLDFSKFSDSMPWEFVDGAFTIIKNYYRKYNALTLEVEYLLNTIKYEITRSLICVGTNVYELQNGVLQGHPITSLINSLVNIIEQVYVFIKITSLNGDVFFKTCGLVVMGDDVVISIPKALLTKYNGQTIAQCFAEMKIVVTDETKDKDNVQAYQPIHNFDFLSCSFALHPYRRLYLAPSDISSIFDTALWIKRPDGPFNDATQENLEQSLMNCFGHGPCIYEMYRATLEFLSGFKFRSWFELDFIFYGNRDITSSMLMYNNALATYLPPKVKENALSKIDMDFFLNQSQEHFFWTSEYLALLFLSRKNFRLNDYKCECRYNCEHELNARITQVEWRTGVPRSEFLPFFNQRMGSQLLGGRKVLYDK